jgi:hypothetical protein
VAHCQKGDVRSNLLLRSEFCMRFLKIIIISVVSIVCFHITAHVAHAQIPDIEGHVLVSGTNAPVVGVWVRLTNDDGSEAGGDCASGATDQSRYALTDSNGRYEFKGWTNMTSTDRDQQIDVNIDTNRDGTNDAVWFPGFSTCDPAETHAQFSCGHDPFSIDVVKPYNWPGSFDSISKSTCEACINNGDPTKTVRDLYYHGSGGGSGGTATPTTASATGTPVPTSTPAPSCTVSSSENPVNIPAGTSRQLTLGPVSINCSSGYSSYRATYTTDPSVVGVCAIAPCTGGSYSDTPAIRVASTATGSVGSTTPLTVTVTDQTTGGLLTTGNFTIRVTNTNPWFQSLNGDLISNGNITTTIPGSCTSPTCRDWLINYSSTRASGIAIGFEGVTINSTSGVVSSPNNWKSTAEYKGTIYDYGYFEKHATCGISHDYGIANKTANDASYFTSFAPNTNGYYWVRYTGDSGNPLTLGNGSDITIGTNKVVLFVKNADLIIRSKIRVTPGRGFFMVVAGNTDGSSNGNIIVDPSVGDAPSGTPDPDLEGIYYAQEQFRTGTLGPSLDEQLYIRGSVAAFDKVVLQRNLTNNSTYPAELFEFAPEFLINYPECLGDRTTNWREEAP